MQSASVEQRLRRFLLAVTAAIFAGSVFELILIGHTQESLQWIPFIISALGFTGVTMVWIAPGRHRLLILRWLMVLTMAASLLGMWLHFSGNLAFTREINPNFSLADSIWPAMKGSYPLLAPGILLLAGVLGYGATWNHPALQDR